MKKTVEELAREYVKSKGWDKVRIHVRASALADFKAGHLKATKWTLVSDELPKHQKDVLCMTVNDDGEEKHSVDSYLTGVKMWLYAEVECTHSIPTYWRDI